MMSLARIIAMGIGVCLGSLVAQDCPPVRRVLPNGTLSGSLGAASCQLVDGTPYTPYRLDLPVRGQIKIALSNNAGDLTLTLRDASGVRIDSGAGLLRPIEAGSYTLLVNGSVAGETGVERIAIGALTHSSGAVDIALDIEVN
jgi:nicotinate-nucleotide pyrophosphorylase (carboxylating)